MFTDEDAAERRRRRNDHLLQYYADTRATSGGYQSMPTDPCNLNAMGFDPDMYMSQMVREKNLSQLMEEEKTLCESTRALDADMQSLVYENYYKFIRATDTIRMMKDNFTSTEKEMELLAEKMTRITQLSSELDESLHTRRQKINKLTQTHLLLKKLQYLFELPQRLVQWIKAGSYEQAVRQYRKARQVLNRYADMPSFQGIRDDCQRIISELRNELWEKFRSDDDPQRISELIRLLWHLGEAPSTLRAEFFTRATRRLDTDLGALERQIELHSRDASDPTVSTEVALDVVEFVDEGCSIFLSDVCLFVTVYDELFISRTHHEEEELEQAGLFQSENEEDNMPPDDMIGNAKILVELRKFVSEQMSRYFDVVDRRMRLEKEGGDNSVIVRALDRFHRRLQAMDRLMEDPAIAEAGLGIVCSVASGRVRFYLEGLQKAFNDIVADLMCLVTSDSGVLTGSGGKRSEDGPTSLESQVQSYISSLVDQIRSSLIALQAFIATDITFTQKPLFRQQFCPQDIREGLVVAFFRMLMNRCTELVDQTSTPPTLLLVLSRLCLDISSSAVEYLMTLADEMYLIDTISAEAGLSAATGGRRMVATSITPVSRLSDELRSLAQRLLDGYVRSQGVAISQMLRKSVETRDWLNTIEPRHVRAVMKRLVEDISRMDLQVTQLYGGGSSSGDKRDRSSDSSRRAGPTAISAVTGARTGAKSTGNWSQWSLTPSTLDQHLMSNIQKLFSEKIEVFSPVELNRESIVTGVIKIGLKTLLECVRMHTFGRYGLQQMQVDCQYLHVHLWRYVADENLVAFLLDEIVVSTAHRCLDAVLMEGSIVELIVEKS